MPKPSNESDQRELKCASLAGPDAVFSLLEQHRSRLRRMVSLRMDRRIQQRVDPSDVIQEAYLEAAQRLSEYVEKPEVPFFVWLRFLTHQKMLQFQQRHLGVQARDPRVEMSLQKTYGPATSAAIAAHLIGRDDTPALAAVKAELRIQLEEGLDELDELDREVLALRHFEQSKNAEVATILGISEKAASKRYFRALGRLKKIMGSSELD